jgi:hypothetical protein
MAGRSGKNNVSVKYDQTFNNFAAGIVAFNLPVSPGKSKNF